MNDLEGYDRKDRQRAARRKTPHPYSWLGLSIAAALAACTVALLVDGAEDGFRDRAASVTRQVHACTRDNKAAIVAGVREVVTCVEVIR